MFAKTDKHLIHDKHSLCGSGVRYAGPSNLIVVVFNKRTG
jgi:hypothetical protein